MERYLFDTNALILYPYMLPNNEEIIIPAIVLHELDKLKMGNGDTAYRCRQAIRKLKAMTNVKYDIRYDSNHPMLFEGYNHDDLILECAKQNGCVLVTGDYLVQLKAEGLGVPYIETNEGNDELYTGIRELFLNIDIQEDVDLLARIFENPKFNYLNLAQNEYLLLWDKTKKTYDDDGNVTGYELMDDGSYRWSGAELVKAKWRKLSSRYLGDIKPKNRKQEILFDMLQNKDVTIKSCVGKFGTGKDFCMISHAISLLESSRFKKIVWVRNNIELKDTEQLGYRKGDLFDKLIEFAMPLADHLGGIEGLKMFVEKGQIELQHLGTVRGRDIKDSIIYVTEVQNNTKDHMQLLLGRVGEGSQLWLNGDLKQVDQDRFVSNNGLRALTKLKGHSLFGQITLDKTERSETAALAELL